MSADQHALYSKAQSVASSNGLALPALMPPVGEWVRFAGAGKNNKNKAAAVMRNHDRVCLIDHSSGWSTAVFPDGSTSGNDCNETRNAYEKVARERAAAEKEEREKSLSRLNSYLHRAVPCRRTPYTDRKGLKFAHNARYVCRDRCMIIELHNIKGELQSAQRIFDNGEKRCWPKLPVTGAFHMIGEHITAQRLLACEGWATGVTLHDQTGLAVVCAMFANNLLPVARAFRDRYPSQSIVICGDDDRLTKGNPGRTKAIEAARTIGAALTFPIFPEGVAGSDFNDMHLLGQAVAL